MEFSAEGSGSMKSMAARGSGKLPLISSVLYFPLSIRIYVYLLFLIHCYDHERLPIACICVFKRGGKNEKRKWATGWTYAWSKGLLA